MEAIDVGAEEESSPVEKHRVQRKSIWLCLREAGMFLRQGNAFLKASRSVLSHRILERRFINVYYCSISFGSFFFNSLQSR